MTNVYENVNAELPEGETIGLLQTTDDLTKIKGIGSGTAEKLNVRKIYTYQQLAEMTPEKLSEAPGIGVVTAKKIIEEAKRFLEGMQGDNKVNLPIIPKEEPVIVKNVKKNAIEPEEELELETCEIVGTVDKEDIELSQPIRKKKVTPYEQLLTRSDNKVEKENIELEELEKLQIEEKPSETVQKPWFNDKFNRSRLTASYPAASKRSSKESKVEIEEIEEIEETGEIEEFEEFEEIEIKTEVEVEERKEEEFEENQEAIPEAPKILETPKQLEINGTVEPFESEILFPEEVIPSEETFNAPVYTELPEATKIREDTKISEVEVPKIAEVQKVPEIIEIPTRPKAPNRREELTAEVVEPLKELGYYAIPSGIEALNPFFQNIDYIGLKLVPVKNNSKLILLVPIKLCDLEGTLLIHENKIDYKTYSKAQDSNLVRTARQYANDLLKAKEAIFEDVVNGENFQEFFEKYLQVRFTVEKSAKNKKLYLVSGQIQYKILIEPILLTKIPAKCMEKSILYPYQRKTNLHVIDRSNITHLLQFLEKKYKLIESRAKKTNSIETYQKADARFRWNLKVTSLPFLGYSVVLLIIYFSQLYFLLRLLNSIGIAVIGIYVFTIAYFYFKFYKTKKELTTEFETPYYLQNLQFSETDLLCVREEFTGEQMAQFGYECFGKDNDSKVLEQVEKEKIKESVAAKQMEQEAPQLFEFDSDPEYSSIKDEPNREIKYSSFLED